MSRHTARAEPVEEHRLTACLTTCAACGQPMPVAYTAVVKSFRTHARLANSRLASPQVSETIAHASLPCRFVSCNGIPFWAHWYQYLSLSWMVTMTDIGVVRPNAHGQAMMSTASPSTKPNTQAGSGPNMSDMATATDRGKVHQNLRLTSASSGFSSPSSEGNAGSSASCIAGNCPAWHAEFPDAPDHCDPDGNFIGMGLPEHDRAAARPQRESWTDRKSVV